MKEAQQQPEKHDRFYPRLCSCHPLRIQPHAHDQSFIVGRLLWHIEHMPAHSGNLYGFPESSITAQRSIKQDL